jgi:hypothetical protein
MRSVAGTVITVDPRVSITDLERLARVRISRDGVTQVAAATADRRQRAQVCRLRRRLVADPGLDVFFGDRPDGVTYLTAYPAGQRQQGVWGDPMLAIVQAELDPDDIEVVEIEL